MTVPQLGSLTWHPAAARTELLGPSVTAALPGLRAVEQVSYAKVDGLRTAGRRDGRAPGRHGAG